MCVEPFALRGDQISLEPLSADHAAALAAATRGAGELYRWSPVPQSLAEAAQYVRTALAWREAGTAAPFVIVDTDGTVIGSTRFWNLDHWSWPAGHARHGRTAPDGCEIGYSWLAPGAVRSRVNTEAKFLMLRHAFETWGVLRVCFHTDVRNARSRGALERIGAQFEGVLRAHRLAADHTARDSARFSITDAEWPAVKAKFVERLAAA